MTPMQIEKQRWIDKYNKIAVKIGQPEYYWRSDSLKQVKQRYAKVHLTFLSIKHILKPTPELKIIGGIND